MADDDERADRHSDAVAATLPIHSESAYNFGEFRGISTMPMPRPPAARNVTRGIVFAASVSIFAALSVSSLAQQPTDQRPAAGARAGATIDDATAAAIAAEGELKATIRTFQGDNPSAVYRYYWWHDSCYVRYPPGNYELVTSDYCHR
jgi:hypothetical protein